MRRLTACFIASFFLFTTPANAAKKPVDWHTFKANRLREASPVRLLAPKLIPHVLPEIRAKYAEWQEAWSNHLEYKEEAETLSYEPANQGFVTSYDGWPIPEYIVMCESGGNYLAENPVSTASGAFQIIDSSWAGYGGYSHASDAPPSVQDAKAALMWAGGAGASHWAACL